MGNFKIFETEQFLKDINQDLGGHRERIKDKLQNYTYPQLRQQPYFGKHIKKLKGYAPETWRYRIGDYRFFYAIDGQKRIVFMLAIDHRANAY